MNGIKDKAVLLGLILIFLIIHLSVFYFAFLKKSELTEFPALRARFGTIVYHSSNANRVYEGAFNDPNAVNHTYCYYPKESTQYQGKSGEYIIKRVDSFWECNEGWYGSFTAREGWWVSEKEKIWWSQEQYNGDNKQKS